MSAKNYEQTAKIETDVMMLSAQTRLIKAQMEHLKAVRFLHNNETVQELKARQFKFAHVMETHSAMTTIFNESFDDIYDDIDLDDESLENNVKSIIHEALGGNSFVFGRQNVSFD
jgi:hypothetical protein